MISDDSMMHGEINVSKANEFIDVFFSKMQRKESDDKVSW